MAKWNKNKVDSSEINNDNEFEKKDNLAINELNAIVNNSFYSVEFSEALADQPDISEISNEGEPSVSFVDNIKDGKTFKKLKFSNLRGKTGTPAGFGTPTATIKPLTAGSLPNISVTASGSNEEKVFNFDFELPESSLPDNIVTTDSEQSISGGKIFTSSVKIQNSDVESSDTPSTQSSKSLTFTDKSNTPIVSLNTTIGSSWNALNIDLIGKDDVTNRIEYVSSSNGATSLDPVTTDTVDLGISGRRWKNLNISGDANIGGNANITGKLNLAATPGNYPHITGDGSIWLTTNGAFDTTAGLYGFEELGFRPSSQKNRLQNLGAPNSEWKNLYLGGDLYDYGSRARAGRYSSETGTYYFEVARCLITVDGYRGCMAKFEAQDFDQPQKCVVEVQTYKGALTAVPQATIAVTDTSGGGSNTRWQNRFYIVANYVTDGTNVTSQKVLYQIFYKTTAQYEAIHCKFTHELADYRDAKPTFWTKFENTTTATGTTAIPNNFTYKDIDDSLTSGTVKQVIATDNLLKDLGTATSCLRDVYLSGNISNGTNSVSINNLITNTTFTTGTGTLNSTFVKSGVAQWIKVGRLVLVNISDMVLHNGKSMKHLDAYITGLPQAGTGGGRIVNIFPYPAGSLGHNRVAILEGSTSLVNWYDDFVASDGAGYFGVFAYYTN